VSDLRLQDFDRLVTRGSRVLKAGVLRDELKRAVAWAPAWTFIGLLCALVFQVPVTIVVAPILALLGPMLYVLVRVVLAHVKHHPQRAGALGRFDALMQSKDRLVTADEFLRRPEAARTGFEQAAIDDAESTLRDALNRSLEQTSTLPWHVRRIGLVGVAAAALILALPYLLALWNDTGVVPLGVRSPVLADARDRSRQSSDYPEKRSSGAGRVPIARANDTSSLSESASTSTEKAERSAAREERTSPSDTRAAKASPAQSSSASGQGAGVGSEENSAPSPQAEKPRTPNPDNAAKIPRLAQAERKNGSSSPSTAPSSGSGRSTSTPSNALPLEQAERPDAATQPPKQDDTADASEENQQEQKADAVSTPGPRDRKAPVDRNSSTRPAGDKVSPTANGRGGPSGRKKTRGVPSMILGIPLADRVEGIPNPGNSRVTRERTKSTAETHSSIEASPRIARSDRAGEVVHPPLLPWMQTLIRDYFTR